MDAQRTFRSMATDVSLRVVDPAPDVDARLQAPVPRAVRREVQLAALEQAHLPPRVVREDVAERVVGERGRDPVEPRAIPEVREHRLDALVGKVARERECRRLEPRGGHAPTLEHG